MQRVRQGYDLVFQALLRHHTQEVQLMGREQHWLREELSVARQNYEYLKNDIHMINRLLPQVQALLPSP